MTCYKANCIYDFAALHLYRFKGKGKSDRFVMFVTVIQPGPWKVDIHHVTLPQIIPSQRPFLGGRNVLMQIDEFSRFQKHLDFPDFWVTLLDRDSHPEFPRFKTLKGGILAFPRFLALVFAGLHQTKSSNGNGHPSLEESSWIKSLLYSATHR